MIIIIIINIAATSYKMGSSDSSQKEKSYTQYTVHNELGYVN